MALLPRTANPDIPPPAPLPKYLASRGRVGEGRSLKLKRLLLRHELTNAELARHIIQSNGRALSRPAAQSMVTYGLLPTTTPFDQIRKQTADWLISKGVSPEEIATAFDVEDGVVDLNAHPTDHFAVSDDARALTLQLRTAGVPEDVITKTINGLRRANRAPRGREPESPPPVQPLEKFMLSPAALKHFELPGDPFTEEISSSDDIFRGTDVNEIREQLWRCSKRHSLTALLGESGSGKTWLRQDLEDRINRSREKVRIIRPLTLDAGRITANTICGSIIQDIAPGSKIPATPENQARRARALLIGSVQEGWHNVLIFEEAHKLTTDALRSIKVVSELQDGFKRLLSIVMIGQNPEFDLLLNELANPRARELIKRVTKIYMKPLHTNALKPFLKHKFERAGGDVARVLDESAYGAILADRIKMDQRTKRTFNDCHPLAVQNLLTLAMNEAAVLGAPRVTADIVVSAVKNGGR